MNIIQKALVFSCFVSAITFMIILGDNHGYVSNEIVFYRPIYLYDVGFFLGIIGAISPILYITFEFWINFKSSKFIQSPEWAKEMFIKQVFHMRRLAFIFIVIAIFFGLISYKLSSSIMIEDTEDLIGNVIFALEVMDYKNVESYEMNKLLLNSLKAQQRLIDMINKKNFSTGMLLFGCISIFSLCLGLFYFIEAQINERSINKIVARDK